MHFPDTSDEDIPRQWSTIHHSSPFSKIKKLLHYFWPVEEIRYFLMTSQIWALNEISNFFLMLLKPRQIKVISPVVEIPICPLFSRSASSTVQGAWPLSHRSEPTVKILLHLDLLQHYIKGTEHQHIEVRFILLSALCPSRLPSCTVMSHTL